MPENEEREDNGSDLPEQPDQPDQPDQLEEPDKPLENIFEALEGIVGQLEEGERSLEDSLRLFARGIQLCRQGTERLDATESAIEELLRDADGNDVVAPAKDQP